MRRMDKKKEAVDGRIVDDDDIDDDDVDDGRREQRRRGWGGVEEVPMVDGMTVKSN